MPDPPRAVHPAALPEAELLKGCTFERRRASGPGGQHRNKVETAVRVTHSPTGITAEASERRRQAENRAVAVFRLRLRLATEVRTACTAEPSERWRRRVRDGRLSINPGHDEFPAVLAEAMDHLQQADHDPATAAAGLGVSATQLLKLLKRHPPALEALNAQRLAAGRHALR